MSEHIQISTVGTGTKTKSGESMVAYGIAAGVQMACPKPSALYLVTSAHPDSLDTAELALMRLDELQLGTIFRPISKQQRFFELADPDDLEGNTERIGQLIRQLQATHPNATVSINPTSGTKQMTAAAVLAAISSDTQRVEFTAGQRIDGVVKTGTERNVGFELDTIQRRKTTGEALRLFNLGFYDAGILLLEPWEDTDKITDDILNAGRVLAHWDRFNYAPAAASSLMLAGFNPETVHPELQDGVTQLATSLHALEQLATQYSARGDNALLRIADLLANARRRIAQRDFDDAVTRLYRCVEMTLRYRLKSSHDIDLDQPETARPRLRELGEWSTDRQHETYGINRLFNILSRSNDLIADFWGPHRPLQKLIEARNHSYIGHGTKVLDENTANRLATETEALVRATDPEADFLILSTSHL